MQNITLNNGIKMPMLGFGTYGVRDVRIFKQAIDLGYHLFDTAQMYNNEKEIGIAINEAIKSQNIKREEFFITSKLSSNMDFAHKAKHRFQP